MKKTSSNKVKPIVQSKFCEQEEKRRESEAYAESIVYSSSQSSYTETSQGINGASDIQ